MSNSIEIGFLIFPNMTQLDVAGPAEVLSRIPGAKIHLLWRDLDPVDADAGFSVNPTTRLEDCPDLDVLCICGGLGVVATLTDATILEFVREQGRKARYVTSVCSGSLLLGAAGLLEGYNATCHWAFLDMLKDFGAHPVAERVVQDRNRISGGGVTAGIDFGLALAAELAGPEIARAIQLFIEYDPQPPFDSGSPQKASPETLDLVKQWIADASGA